MKTALETIGSQCDLNFQLDSDALEELRLDSNPLVSVKAKNVSVESVLGLMLVNLGLCAVPADGIVRITSDEFAQGEYMTRLHDVRALIKNDTDEARLISILTATVDPDTWEELGGGGTMYGYYGVLVVSTTHEVHTKTQRVIESLTDALGSGIEAPKVPPTH